MNATNLADCRPSAAGRGPIAGHALPLRYLGEALCIALEAAARISLRAPRLAVAKWRERMTIERLSGLDDHTLQDIGIDRSQIPHLVRRLIDDRRLDRG